jgi:hypothetical protein
MEVVMPAKETTAKNARNEARLMSMLIQAVRVCRRAVPMQDVERAVGHMDRDAVSSLMMGATDYSRPLDPRSELRLAAGKVLNLPRLFQLTMMQSADSVRYDLKIGKVKAKDGLTSFNKVTPEAVEWARAQSAKLIRGLSSEARAAVQTIISEAFSKGYTSKSAARMLREVVGLTPQYADAVANLYGRLVTAKPGSLVKAGKTRIRVPRTGLGWDRIDTITNRYAQRLVNHRMKMIARNEIITASSEGQTMLWNEAVKNGELDASTIEQVWTSALDTRRCSICAGLQGQVAPLNGLFLGRYKAPPAHVGCRCSRTLRRASQRKVAA